MLTISPIMENLSQSIWVDEYDLLSKCNNTEAWSVVCMRFICKVLFVFIRNIPFLSSFLLLSIKTIECLFIVGDIVSSIAMYAFIVGVLYILGGKKFIALKGGKLNISGFIIIAPVVFGELCSADMETFNMSAIF